MHQHHSDKNGYIILISVLVVSAVIVSVSVSLLLLSLGSARTSLSLEESNQAKALANACAEEALQQIYDSVAFSGSGNLSLSIGNCTYTVIDLGGQNRQIQSTGSAGNSIRRVNIILDAITPQINITSWQEVINF